MAEMDDEGHENQEEILEDRTLNLLHDSKIDQVFSELKARKRGARRHKVRWMKRPMAIPEVILELQEENFRENALRCLSNFLLDNREEDLENYYRTGFLLFNSCATMSILMQEVVSFYGKMVNGSLNVRSSKRLINVLTLFQSIAANVETREKFVNTSVPNFLIPLVRFESTEEVFECVRVVSLSVIGILCQAREFVIIQWAVMTNLVDVCRTSIEIGSELSKVIAMHILEAILRNGYGISNICHPKCDRLLKGLMKTWEHLITLLAVHQDLSPRLLFHIIRCYVLLCNHSRGFDIVMENLPAPFMNDSFHDITEEFPVIRTLLHQLLVNVGKAVEVPVSRSQVHVPPAGISYDCSNWKDGSVPADMMRLKTFDLDKKHCSPASLAR